MTQSPDDKSHISVNVGGILNITYLSPVENTLVIPIPLEAATAIGEIVVLWGGFEQRMDAILEWVFAFRGVHPPEKWRREPFKKRKKIFRQQMIECCRLMFPQEEKVFRQIADTAGVLHWQRNAVAHGYVEIRHKPNPNAATGSDAFFVARGQHNGRDVEISLDRETLSKLRHDVAHLGGKLMAATFRMGGNIENGSPEIVVADKHFFGRSRWGIFQTLATPIIDVPQKSQHKM